MEARSTARRWRPRRAPRASPSQLEDSKAFNLVAWEGAYNLEGVTPGGNTTIPYVKTAVVDDFIVWVEIWSQTRDGTTLLPRGLRRGWVCVDSSAPLKPDDHHSRVLTTGTFNLDLALLGEGLLGEGEALRQAWPLQAAPGRLPQRQHLLLQPALQEEQGRAIALRQTGSQVAPVAEIVVVGVQLASQAPAGESEGLGVHRRMGRRGVGVEEGGERSPWSPDPAPGRAAASAAARGRGRGRPPPPGSPRAAPGGSRAARPSGSS